MCIFNFIELTDVYIFSDTHGGEVWHVWTLIRTKASDVYAWVTYTLYLSLTLQSEGTNTPLK